MWSWKHNQRKEAEESTVTPEVAETRRIIALQYALSAPGGPGEVVDTAEEYLKFLNGGE